MVMHPFFCLKIGRLKATVHMSNTSIYVKTGSPDPADFATIRLPIHWHITL
jgi:hypothetical protein